MSTPKAVGLSALVSLVVVLGFEVVQAHVFDVRKVLAGDGKRLID